MAQHDRYPIVLVDDGTLDTVLECVYCNERFRYNDDGGTYSHAAFVGWAIEDARGSHVCDDEDA